MSGIDQIRRAPREGTLVGAVTIGQVGSFIIANKRYSALMWEFVGSQAVLVGYVLAIAAVIGLKGYVKSLGTLTRAEQRYVLVFSFAYTLCLITPFGAQCVIPLWLSAVLQILAVIAAAALGHWFHKRVQLGRQRGPVGPTGTL